MRIALRRIDRGRVAAPVHPGVILRDEFLLPFDISQNALARYIGVAPRRINEIVLGKRAISADTALRLAAALGPSARFWIRLQADYDLAAARARHGEPVLHDDAGGLLELDEAHGGVAPQYLSCACSSRGNCRGVPLSQTPLAPLA